MLPHSASSCAHLVRGHALHLRVRLVENALHGILIKADETVRYASKGDGKRLRRFHNQNRPEHFSPALGFYRVI